MAATKKKVDYGAKAKTTQRKTAEQNSIADGASVAPTPTGEESIQESKPSTTAPGDLPKTPQAKTARSISATNQNTTQISFRISMDLKRRLRIYAANHDQTVNEAFREILDDWLSKHT